MKTLSTITLLTLALVGCATPKGKQAPVKTVEEANARYHRSVEYQDPFTPEEKEAQKRAELTDHNSRLKEENRRLQSENDRLRQHTGILSEKSGKRLSGHDSSGKPIFQKNVDISTEEELLEKKAQDKMERDQFQDKVESREDQRFEKSLQMMAPPKVPKHEEEPFENPFGTLNRP